MADNSLLNLLLNKLNLLDVALSIFDITIIRKWAKHARPARIKIFRLTRSRLKMRGLKKTSRRIINQLAAKPKIQSITDRSRSLKSKRRRKSFQFSLPNSTKLRCTKNLEQAGLSSRRCLIILMIW